MNGKTVLHFVNYLLGIDPPHTQTSDAERACLSIVARNKKQVAEIGVYEGATTRLLVEAMDPTGKLYAIDPFIAGRLGICWGKQIALREVNKIRPRAHMELVEQYSHQAARLISGQFDLIFIDGDHSLEGITRDWADWSDRVEQGGIVALHDTRVPAHNPNVASLGSYQYFEEHVRYDDRFELVQQVDSLSIMRRR